MQRGEVYRFNVPKGLGHEQQGERFGVVVQADAMLPRSVILVGLLAAEEMWAVDEALLTVLGLE